MRHNLYCNNIYCILHIFFIYKEKPMNIEQIDIEF